MEQKALLEILVQSKRFGNLLDEVLELSRQLEDAMYRNDQVVIEMVMAMRMEPVLKLKQVDRILEEQRNALPSEDRERVLGLIGGTVLPEGREEELLVQQAARNQRLHKRVMELDEHLNRRLTRGNSFYQ